MKSRFLLLFILISSSLFAATDPEVFPPASKFPVPEAYEKNVQFWMRVYGEWDDDKMAIHDTVNMDVVFDVVEMPDENSLLRTAAGARLRERIAEIKSILLELHADRQAAQKSPEHKRIFDLYSKNYDPDKFRKASENLRVQQGIKDRFERGLEQMTIYIDQIKEVFRSEGMPEEIAYLPLVESSFNNQSLSKTRAAGIWQFMPGTAKLYMKVNSDVDERLDPYVATRSAARYLKRSYQLFGNWPVSLMSYNHGQQGMVNAMRQVGSADFLTIITRYEGKYFGFASRNFYAEFVAACRVMKNAHEYFDDLDYQAARSHTTLKLSKPVYVSALLTHTGLDRETLREYNPALQSTVIFSRRPVPAGYELRLPSSRFKDTQALTAKLKLGEADSTKPSAVSTKPSSPPPVSAVNGGSSGSSKKLYVVRRGDTLFSISLKFDTTVEAIRRLNKISGSTIVPGQKLNVPAS